MLAIKFCKQCQQPFSDSDRRYQYCEAHRKGSESRWHDYEVKRRRNHLCDLFEQMYQELHCNFPPDLKQRCYETLLNAPSFPGYPFPKVIKLLLYEFSQLDCSVALSPMNLGFKLRRHSDLRQRIQALVPAGTKCTAPTLTIRNVRRFCTTYPEFQLVQERAEALASQLQLTLFIDTAPHIRAVALLYYLGKEQGIPYSQALFCHMSKKIGLPITQVTLRQWFSQLKRYSQ